MESRKRINRKDSRTILGRASKPKKRPKPPNRHEFERKTASTSASAKKLKSSHAEVSVNAMHGYRIINFLAMFSSLSEIVKCKTCNGNVTFSESSIRGLGFKLVINCHNYEPRYINSCPLIQNAYEINRRIVFAMTLFGIGYEGIRKFCGSWIFQKWSLKRFTRTLIQTFIMRRKLLPLYYFLTLLLRRKT